MPFKSQKQRRFLHANKPAMANRWEREAKAKKQAPVQKQPKRKRK